MSCTHFIHGFPSPKEWVRGVANVWIDALKEAWRLRAALGEERIWHPPDGSDVQVIRLNCEKMKQLGLLYPMERHLAFLVPVGEEYAAAVWMRSDGHMDMSELLKSALRGERKDCESLKGLWPVPEEE